MAGDKCGVWRESGGRERGSKGVRGEDGDGEFNGVIHWHLATQHMYI